MENFATTKRFKSKTFTYTYTGGEGAVEFDPIFFESENGIKSPEMSDGEITVMLWVQVASGTLGGCSINVIPVDSFGKPFFSSGITPAQDYNKILEIPNGSWIESIRGEGMPYGWVITMPKCFGLFLSFATDFMGTEDATITIEVLY
ncbi:MAG: hypothetical protein AMQ22_00203 [Candidatus Methanofastidiosum methylothiophilum]|uniref:Uncharacterized protein n=1 Tax=Candidatus Methanofastidiosum methylothiophilum TaxID=1705564 RepID=A0A150ISE1_9EURY|nr:MAG: hypothetical protein APG11_00838 [Candidatus Methanofastidiosum methylthiophilus]KYC53532.1 MAG: hypothetical protein AMQ22_00203 [Candidatus Methanofastidiosum methylthiophilus]